MFNLFKKKSKGNTIKFKISGMHCTSCAMNIDGDLEDVDGVYSASTSYAKSVTQVNFDPDKTNTKNIQKVIKKSGYSSDIID